MSQQQNVWLEKIQYNKLTRENIAVAVLAHVRWLQTNRYTIGLGLICTQTVPLQCQTVLVLEMVLHVRLEKNGPFYMFFLIKWWSSLHNGPFHMVFLTVFSYMVLPTQSVWHGILMWYFVYLFVPCVGEVASSSHCSLLLPALAQPPHARLLDGTKTHNKIRV